MVTVAFPSGNAARTRHGRSRNSLFGSFGDDIFEDFFGGIGGMRGKTGMRFD